MSTKAEDTQKNILNTARKHFLKDGLTGAEYSRAVTPQIRQAGNRLSGLAETAYASLLA